jgi:hypothetical protein
LGYNACFICRYPERLFDRCRPQNGCDIHQSPNPKAPGLWPEKTKTRLLAQNCDWTSASYPAEIPMSIHAKQEFTTGRIEQNGRRKTYN